MSIWDASVTGRGLAFYAMIATYPHSLPAIFQYLTCLIVFWEVPLAAIFIYLPAQVLPNINNFFLGVFVKNEMQMLKFRLSEIVTVVANNGLTKRF